MLREGFLQVATSSSKEYGVRIAFCTRSCDPEQQTMSGSSGLVTLRDRNLQGTSVPALAGKAVGARRQAQSLGQS